MPFLTGLINAKVSLYKEKLYDLDSWAYNSTLQHTLGTTFISHIKELL